MCRWIVVALVVAMGCTDVVHAQNRGRVIWTISGGGVGFGVGLWAGLTAFDDAVDSDRKVWTSALVGAGVGAVAGYLLGRTRDARNRPAKAANEIQIGQRAAAERQLLESMTGSFRYTPPLHPDLIVGFLQPGAKFIIDVNGGPYADEVHLPIRTERLVLHQSRTVQ